MNAKTFILKCAIATCTFILFLVMIDLGLRAVRTAKRIVGTWRPPLYIVLNSPVLYGLNPKHHEINSHGLRDDEVSLQKPSDTYRILVLGDSIAYGPGVKKQETFAKRLQTLLRADNPRIEVLNSGVSGYSPYSELQFYLSEGRAFHPDIVIVAFCMNDVVNPRVHWDWTQKALAEIPLAAIPNREYDKNHIQPIVDEIKKQKGMRTATHFSLLAFFRASPLYQLVAGRIRSIKSKWGMTRDLQSASLPDVKTNLPTYLTTEDSISIEVLMKDSSPEWLWLTDIYSQLKKAIEQDGASMGVVLFPLAYQLDAKYPFLPQQRLAAYCKAQGILCVDLLPVFRKYAPVEIFQLQNNAAYYDIWHLTSYGHQVTAETLAATLKEKGALRAP